MIVIHGLYCNQSMHMNYWDAIILGIVQGLTEFLPISSTAHIIIAGRLLGLTSPGLALEIYLHIASVIAVIGYFRHDLLKIFRSFSVYAIQRNKSDRAGFLFGCYIIMATIITGALGLPLTEYMGDELKSPYVIGVALWVTAAFLIFIEKGFTYGSRREGDMKWRDAVFVGLGQSVAVLPGISRSGSTLVTALLCGLERETAVRYSFILAIPVILGSSFLGIRHVTIEWILESGLAPLALSFAVSLAASLVGIIWLIRFLRQGRLYWFAIYCFILGSLSILYLP